VVDWATACARDGAVAPLPAEIAQHKIDRFRTAAALSASA